MDKSVVYGRAQGVDHRYCNECLCLEYACGGGVWLKSTGETLDDNYRVVARCGCKCHSAAAKVARRGDRGIRVVP